MNLRWLIRPFQRAAASATPAAPEPAPAPQPAIKKAVVIGAGAMGGGIAAQFANAGIPVTLLDIVPKSGENRNAIAEGAVERMRRAELTSDPLNAGFMTPAHADLVSTGNIEDHLADAVADADWIVEAAIEDPDIKKALFEKIDAHRKPGSVVSSNTSTIPLATLTEGRSEDFRRYAMITHFFNPVRIMRAMELVRGAETADEAVDLITRTVDRRLGKSVIECEDTPGFIANRGGTYFMMRAIGEALERGMPIEDVDAVLSRPMGFPKDGVFGLLDLVGLGLVPMVTGSLKKNLPAQDGFHQIYRDVPLIETMLKDGRTGRKSPKGGFYHMVRDEDGGKTLNAIDLKTGEYHEVSKKDLAAVKAGRKGLRAVFEAGDEAADFARTVMVDTLAYFAAMMPEASERIEDIDEAMRKGYNWKRGPFEMIDSLSNDKETGVDWLVRQLEQDGKPVPPLLTMAKGQRFYKEIEGEPSVMIPGFAAGDTRYKPLPAQEGVLRFADIKRTQQPLATNMEASAWDFGDGVVCVELHGMKDTLGEGTMHMLNEALDIIEHSSGKYKAMMIASDSEQFSVGANLGMASLLMNTADVERLDDVMWLGQSTLERVKYAPFPVVAAVKGYAFGGGCEVAMHCDHVQAHAETYMGLVEAGVGLVPGWRGCTEYLDRCIKASKKSDLLLPPEFMAFSTIAKATVGLSAHEAKRLHFLRPGDSISMNGDYLLADAKQAALDLAEGYQPPQPATYRLEGPVQKTMFDIGVEGFYKKGVANEHDVTVAHGLATILSGGDTDPTRVLRERDIAALEREVFLALARLHETRARVAHTVQTSKPLREPMPDDPPTAEALRERLRWVTIKDRSGEPHPLDAKTAAAAPAAVPADIKSMNNRQLAAHVTRLLREDSFMPVPGEGIVSAAFNKAAAETRTFWLGQANNFNIAVGFKPDYLLGQAGKMLAASIEKTRKELNETGLTDERRSALEGRQAMNRHLHAQIQTLAMAAK